MGILSKKRVMDCEDFLKAVRRVNTLANKPIADYLGIGKATVWRFQRDNPDCVKQAQDYLDSVTEENVTATKMTWELFLAQRPIRQWKELMIRKPVSEGKMNQYMRGFYNLCRHLNRLPSKITVEECARVVLEQRNRYLAGDPDDPQIKGIAYSVIRESVRSFFMYVHEMGGMALTNLGVDKSELKGSGKYARQKVPQPVRHEYERLLIHQMSESGQIKFFEVIGNSKFCFATGTRISASLAFSFRLHQYNLQKDKWMFEIWDKGTRGKKIRWEKILMGNLLDMFKEYCSKRFEIPIDKLESKLPTATDYLFPSFVREDGRVQDGKIRNIVKPTLIEAGIPYDDFPPTHIWRHTFAQEFLLASDYNYELCCSLGGWKNSHILKKHYGQMSETAREAGLLHAMGEDIPQMTYELRW